MRVFFALLLLILGGCNTNPPPAQPIPPLDDKGWWVSPLSPTKFVQLPDLSSIRVELESDANGPIILTRKELEAQIQATIPGVKITSAVDGAYCLPTQEFFEDCVAYVLWISKRYNRKWMSQVWDCDDFADAVNFVARNALQHQLPDIKAAPAIGSVSVDQDHTWGRVKGGDNWHAIAGVANSSPQLAEPQNGWTGLLEDYPNQIKVIDLQ